MISFTAYGIPAPKGSTKAFYRPGMRFPVVTDDCKRTRPWAAIIKGAAIDALKGTVSIPLALGPVSLAVVFYMPRPKSLPKKVTEHTKKPDLDKLVRALKDALTGIVWTDDSQVVQLQARKVYVAEQAMPRAEIRVDQFFEMSTEVVHKEQGALWEASFR
jgi:crossover junction endodeoxyribonuclease RusA